MPPGHHARELWLRDHRPFLGRSHPHTTCSPVDASDAGRRAQHPHPNRSMYQNELAV